MMLADPEGSVGDDSVVHTEGFGPELALELEETAFVAAEHEAVDEKGPEARVGDGRGFLQRFAIEEVLDVFGQAMEAGIEVVPAGVLRHAAFALGGAGTGRFLSVGAVGGEAALGDGLLCHGGGSRLRALAGFAPEGLEGGDVGAAAAPGAGLEVLAGADAGGIAGAQLAEGEVGAVSGIGAGALLLDGLPVTLDGGGESCGFEERVAGLAPEFLGDGVGHVLFEAGGWGEVLVDIVPQSCEEGLVLDTGDEVGRVVSEEEGVLGAGGGQETARRYHVVRSLIENLHSSSPCAKL
jgi:hypothetical protein